MEYTLVILKPEVFERKIIGKILSYWDGHGFDLVTSRILKPTAEEIKIHYEEVLKSVTEEVGNDIIKRMIRGKCMFLIYKGKNVIKKSREFIGATEPSQANKNTIRAIYGNTIRYNVVHSSDSKTNALKEIKLWFPRWYSLRERHM